MVYRKEYRQKMSVLSDRLKELRGTTSQSEMARTLGMPRPQWIRYETGKSVPGADILANICRAHACSADWLLGLRDPGAPASAPAPQTAAQQCAKCPYKIKLAKFEKLLKA